MAPQQSSVGPDTPIVIKVTVNEASIRKFKLPLKELGAGVLPNKLRSCLDIQHDETVLFERFSDSAGGYITLDPNQPAVFKTLIRAAKAKLKLRLKATVTAPAAQSTPIYPSERTNQQESIMPATAPAPASQIYQFYPPQSVKKESATSAAMEPVIVRSSPNSRDSTALDRRSVGSGIFQFREARASQQTLVNEEAPATQPFRDVLTSVAVPVEVAQMSLPIRTSNTVPAVINTGGRPWSVYCNECDTPIGDGHFHCSICDGGDYDLCEGCVTGGKLCPGEGHWLIKRFIKDGKVINSTTERISPRSARLPQPVKVEVQPTKVEPPKAVPGAFTEETKEQTPAPNLATRTCNNCVVILNEDEFVTCTTCDDFDLCVPCFEEHRHGHHPAHGFEAATRNTILSPLASSLLAAGRNVRHEAICDGCNSTIYGVRHKCLNCPDWDYCGNCVKQAASTHPRHRFAALYEPIAPQLQAVRHFGIYCDGPLCKGKDTASYITGNRYKCAVCHDTDFCANCEAHPCNHHNRTHPLIMFKTPVRNVNVSTENQDVSGKVRMMGDRHAAASTSSNSTASPVPPQMETTKCQTVADIKPFVEEKKTIFNIPVRGPVETPAAPIVLNAHFKQDTIADGTTMPPGNRFTQVWTLRNPGPHVWPAGCSVRYVGGDNMLNVDNTHPMPATDIQSATESNVVGREVHVGEEIAFSVTLKAPTRFGKAISYWRLKSPDGTPFGHRLWCDIDVKRNIDQPAYDAFSDFDRELKLHLERKKSARQSAPPDYNSLSSDLSARFATMRAESQRRRDHLMNQMQTQRCFQGPKREDMPGFRQHINPGLGHSVAGPSMTEEDKARKEAAKQRMEVIKAKIMKSREERHNMVKSKLAEDSARVLESIKAQQPAPVAPAPVSDFARYFDEQVALKEKADQEQKAQKIIQAVMGDGEAAKPEPTEEGNLMVFPRLDKESPESSTYQSATSSRGKGKAAWVEDEEGEVEGVASRPATIAHSPRTTPNTPTGDDFEDLNDEIEVLSAGDDSEDDGFLTDEEYDILDASDRETVASP